VPPVPSRSTRSRRIQLPAARPGHALVRHHALAAKIAEQLVQVVGRIPLFLQHPAERCGHAFVRSLTAPYLLIDVDVDGDGFASHVLKLCALESMSRMRCGNGGFCARRRHQFLAKGPRPMPSLFGRDVMAFGIKMREVVQPEIEVDPFPSPRLMAEPAW